MLLFKDERGVWYAARYEDVDSILKNRRFGRKALHGTECRLPFEQRQEQADGLAVLNIDPSDDTRIRGLLTKAFNAGSVEAMRSALRLVNEILDHRVERGAMEISTTSPFRFRHRHQRNAPHEDRQWFARLSNDIIAFGSGALPSVDEETRRGKLSRPSDAVRRSAPIACQPSCSNQRNSPLFFHSTAR